MKFSIIIILIFTLLTTACTTTPKKPVVIAGSGTQYAKWQEAVLEECSNKAAEITLKIVAEKYKEGYLIMEKDIVAIHKYLTEKCSVDSGIVI